MSPALQGRFLTTVVPEKSLILTLKVRKQAQKLEVRSATLTQRAKTSGLEPS